MRAEGIDWVRVRRLAHLSGDGVLADLGALAALVDAAAPSGLLAWPTAHRIVADDVSALDRLYHVGLVHLYVDAPCCDTRRHRGCYSIHWWNWLT